jgi:hypothetical protein
VPQWEDGGDMRGAAGGSWGSYAVTAVIRRTGVAEWGSWQGREEPQLIISRALFHRSIIPSQNSKSLKRRSVNPQSILTTKSVCRSVYKGLHLGTRRASRLEDDDDADALDMFPGAFVSRVLRAFRQHSIKSKEKRGARRCYQEHGSDDEKKAWMALHFEYDFDMRYGQFEFVTLVDAGEKLPVRYHRERASDGKKCNCKAKLMRYKSLENLDYSN